MSLEELLKLLPQILFYLIGGYIFVSIYRFVTCKDRINSAEDNIMASLTLGFIIKEACEAAGQNSIVIYILLCAVIAYLLALLSCHLNSSSKIEPVLHMFKINRTSYSSIWYDFLPPNSNPIIVKLVDQEHGIYYKGLVRRVEENAHSPFIVLSNYRKYACDNTLLEDCSKNNKIRLMLKAESFSSIERVIISQ